MRTYRLKVAGAILLALLAVLGVAGQSSTPPQQPPGAPPAQPTAAEQAAIQRVFQATDPQQRLTLAEEFLTTYTESPLRGRAYAAAAEVYRMQNNYAKAVEYGERAIESSPRDAFSMILVADALAESSTATQADYQERLAKAEEYARRALQILPELFAAVPRRAEVPEEEYIKQRQYIEAQPHAALGYIYLRRNQYEQAEAEFTQAVQLNQWRPNAADYQRLGVVEMRLKKYEQAGAAFQRCAEIAGPADQSCKTQFDGVQRLIKIRGAAQPQEPPKPEKPQE